MNLHALRIFYTVATLNSFSKAADALCISQPGISKALKELEYQLDTTLINRAAKGRKLTLTAAGETLFEHAKSIFAIEKSALDDIKARIGLKKGTLVLGTSTTIANYWLPPYLAQFCRQYPDIAVEVQVANTAQIEQALLDCSIDLALVEGSTYQQGIQSTVWQHDTLRVVMASADRVDGHWKHWLSQQVWLVREPGSGTLEMTEKWLAQHQIQPLKRIQLGSNEAIAHAVAQAVGVALLPQVVTADLLTLGRVQAVSLPDATNLARPLYQLQFKQRPSSHAAQAFKTLLFAKPC